MQKGLFPSMVLALGLCSGQVMERVPSGAMEVGGLSFLVCCSDGPDSPTLLLSVTASASMNRDRSRVEGFHVSFGWPSCSCLTSLGLRDYRGRRAHQKWSTVAAHSL